jgi:hypothetical protein
MAIFRGVGGSGSSSDNSFLQEVTAQATIATNKASEASASATSASASATSAANSLATIQNTEVTSASFNTGDGVLTLTKLGGATVTADLDGRFLTSYTETNDLSSAVTWVNVPNAYITEGSVTQHQSAINANVSITESQISDLQSYLTSETSHADVLVDGDFTSNGFMKRTGVGTYAIDSNTYLTSEANNLTTAVTWANVPDANITQSSVTQHQAALSITESQISDLQTYLTAETNDLSTTVTWANVPDANITESSVTQHQAALSITESQISDLGTYLTASDITGKANLSGATFTGGVSIGTLPSNPENLSVTGATNLYGGASVTGDITVTGTVDGRDVATDGTKLDGIEASADVTDTANVTAAGALMDSEVTNLAQVKAFDSSDYATAAQGSTADSALQNVVEDTTPQLGGDLDLNGNDITGTGNISADTFTGGDTVLTQTGILASDAVLTLKNTDSGNVSAPHLLFDRISGSPADNDGVGQINFQGRDSANQATSYVTIVAKADDVTNATEDGQLEIYTRKAGVNTKIFDLTSTKLTLDSGTDLDVEGDITVGGTVDGVDLATTIVDGDFTSNGFMKRTGAGTYTVDTNNYVTTSGGTFYGDVTVTGIPTSGEGTLTANFIKGSTISGGATTPVIDLEKNVTGINGSGRFIEFNTKNLATGSIVTRGHLGINQSSANNSAHPYFSHNDGNCGFALTYSGSSSFNSVIPASTTGASTSSNINLGHQYSRWNGIYLKISPNVSSDIEYKRDIEELSEAEKRVAVACKGLIRKYRMKDAYEEKGESARLHIGIVAQDLQDAFTAEGLDAHRYGMFCSDTWHQATVTTEDEDGNVTTSVEDFELVEHAPEGATNITEITRLSVRYEELLAFIISTT